MKKNAIILLTATLLIFSLISPMAYAKKDENPGKHLAKGKTDKPAAKNGLNNENSPVEHLYLYEKDPINDLDGDGFAWDIVDEGAFAKLTILTHKDKYIYNAHGLEIETDYSLINYAPGTDWDEDPYPNPWPGEGSIEIDAGTSDDEGNVHLKGDWEGSTEGKIWLVFSADFDAEGDPTQMTGWNPTEYLFEYDLLSVYE